jgi:hypothetical protein
MDTTDTTTTTTTWAVVHYIHVRTPHRFIARLFVTDVPGDVDAPTLQRVLTRSGYQFGDFGIPWANHYVKPRKDWEDEVEGAWQRGDGTVVHYTDLVLEPRDGDPRIAITLRLPRDLHDRLRRVAQRRSIPMHTVLVEAVSGYVSVQEDLLERGSRHGAMTEE